MPPEHTLSDRKVTQDLDSGHELGKKKNTHTLQEECILCKRVGSLMQVN